MVYAIVSVAGQSVSVDAIDLLHNPTTGMDYVVWCRAYSPYPWGIAVAQDVDAKGTRWNWSSGCKSCTQRRADHLASGWFSRGIL